MTVKDMKFPIAASAAAHALVLIFAFFNLPGLSGMAGNGGAGRMQMVSLVEGGVVKHFSGKARPKGPATVKVRKKAEVAPSAKPAERRVEVEAIATANEENVGVDAGVAGQGNEPVNGTGKSFEGTGKSFGGEGDAASFKDTVRSAIEAAKFYPMSARERGYEGVVGVRFSIAPDGSVKDVAVVNPCHCDALNKAACEAVRRAGPFPPPPETVTMEVDLSYRLEER